VQIGKAQQAEVNLIGGNCIRMLNGAMKVWGARTLAGDSSLHKYVPIRRLLSFLYKSIDHGTQWAVFEPNSNRLRDQISNALDAFLRQLHSVLNENRSIIDQVCFRFVFKGDPEEAPSPTCSLSWAALVAARPP